MGDVWELPPFSLGWPCTSLDRLRCRIAVREGRDRLQELLARAEGEAELAQVGVGQLGQDLEVDAALGEDLGVGAEAQLIEPAADRLDIAFCRGLVAAAGAHGL